MPTTLDLLDMSKLPRGERLEIIQTLWESIVAEGEPLLISDALRQELQRHADENDADPDSGIPWEVVKAEARRKMGR